MSKQSTLVGDEPIDLCGPADGVPCECTSVIAYYLALAEFVVYTFLLALYLWTQPKNCKQCTLYLVAFVIMTAFGLHVYNTQIILQNTSHCKPISK